jgi:hypothetical protein
MTGSIPGAGEGLEWIIGVLWGDQAGVSISPLGRRTSDSELSTAERYLVVPDARRARMLLPASRVPAAAAVAAGSALRGRGARAQRWAAGLAIRGGVARLTFRDSFEVHVDPDARREPTLVESLSSNLGEPVLLAVNVRDAGPYRKPVAQVLSVDGRTLAYAKIAWNDVTERNVRAEADALEAVATAGITSVSVPRVRSRLAWRGHTVLLTHPMPPRLRRYPASLGPPEVGITRAIAGIWPGGTSPVASSAYQAALRARFGSASTVAPQVVSSALEAMERVDAAFGDIDLAYGAWHGDWAPWNLGRAADGVWAWDWEYARADVPLGFDLPHWFFQRSFIERKASFAEGIEAARRAAPLLMQLGLNVGQVDATLALHALEVAARYVDAMALGAVQNPRFVSGSVAGLASILSGPAAPGPG